MAKYLSIVTGDGTEHIPCSEGLYVKRNSATAMEIYLAGSTAHHLKLVTVGSTAMLVTNIQDALVISAETSWQNSVTPVVLPAGETVTSITMTVFA